MTDSHTSAGSEQEPAEAERPIIRDKRRMDPQTGQVRDPQAQQGDSVMTEENTPAQDSVSAADAAPETEPVSSEPVADTPTDADRAAELQDDLLREKAAFHNYRELMKRERPKDREQAIGSVVDALIPVLDDVHYAREHGDLEGTPFEKIADKLSATLNRFGVEAIGAAGEAFDPNLHEALMHVEAELPPEATGTTVVQVMQPGYKVGDRVVRPARVSVADPA